MTTAEARTVAADPVVACEICGRTGDCLYGDVNDRLYGVPGAWNVLWCPRCDYAWLSPRPRPEALPLCYVRYRAHRTAEEVTPPVVSSEGIAATIRDATLAEVRGYPRLRATRLPWPVRRMLRLGPVVHRATFGLDDLVPHYVPGGTLVDVGCGAGAFLATMRALGWNVRGVDVSPDAASSARAAYDIDVAVGELWDASFAAGSVDVVTMIHSFEHVTDIDRLLAEAERILTPGGTLIIVTPNLRSLSHRLFRSDWLALDAPRHLRLFKPRSLRARVERAGFRVDRVSTGSAMAAANFAFSREIRKEGAVGGYVHSDASPTAGPRLGAWFERAERALLPLVGSIGEEIVLVARKSVRERS